MKQRNQINIEMKFILWMAFSFVWTTITTNRSGDIENNGQTDRQKERKKERQTDRQTDRVWKTDYLLFSVWMEGGNAWVKCMEIQWMIWYWLVCFDSSLFDCLWGFFSDRYGAFVLIIFCFVWWSKRELKRERNWVSLIFWMAFFFSTDSIWMWKCIWIQLNMSSFMHRQNGKNLVAAYEIDHCSSANKLTVTTPCRVYFVDAT